MSPEWPLHVQVAAALGCVGLQGSLQEKGARLEEDRWLWLCLCPEHQHARHGPLGPEVARYDTDWSATGPLIDRFEIALLHPTEWTPEWLAQRRPDEGPAIYGGGPTAIQAICHLIVALGAAGKIVDEC